MSDAFNDVSEVFEGWEQDLSGNRNSGGYVDGRWVQSSTVTFSFKGVVQDASGDDLKIIEEGLRTSESIKIHTIYKLIAQVGSSVTGDLVLYNDQTWLVHNVSSKKIGNYYKAIAVKQ